MTKYIKIKDGSNDLEYEKITNDEVRFHRRWKKVYGYKLYYPGHDNYSHFHGTIRIPERVIDEKGSIGPKGKTYTVTEIGTKGADNGAFFFASEVDEVSIPGTVSVLYNTTFVGCTNLHRVTLNEGLLLIEGFEEGQGGGAFRWCRNLHEIKIPDTVTKVENRAFFDCTNLTEVTIGKSTKTLKAAFYACHNIRKVICRASVPPELDAESFSREVYIQAVLYVPRNSFNLYRNSLYWNSFVNIQPFDM